jgi:uncharacterized protein (UPF0332 family)
MNEAFDRQQVIAYRMGRARETLQDAQLLFRNGGSPESIINRAYYAIFYATLALMAEQGINLSRHSSVIARFDQDFVKSGLFPKSMSRILHRAFDLRQIGDYREMLNLTSQQAEEILRDTEQFLRTVEAYFQRN